MYRQKNKASVNAAAKKWQNKVHLKTGLALLITVGLCGWVLYGLFNPKITVRYNDFAIDSAIAWLENADRQDFDACRKNIVDSNGWFDWFVPDRKSLGTVKSRNLAVRQELPDAPAGMNRYELKFNSQFSKSAPNSNVSEKMIIETDGHNQLKVLTSDYWFSGGSSWLNRPATADEKLCIMAVVEDVFKRIDAKDIAFFKQKYAEITQQPDYFGWNKYFVNYAKNPKMIIDICELLAKGKSTSRKFIKLEKYVQNGRTGFEGAPVHYIFSVKMHEKLQNFMLVIEVSRDCYQNKSAEWKFYNLYFIEEKGKQK